MHEGANVTDSKDAAPSRPKRRPISKRIRFEVFKRDQFTCQYCGRKAPDVVLHVDHVDPVARGGDSSIINLLTACVNCNLGKSDRTLSDASALAKQRAQLESLQIRREQLQMMAQWKRGLMSLQDDAAGIALGLWEKLTTYSLNEHGKRQLAKMIRKYPLDEILDGMQDATERNLQLEDGKPTRDSVQKAWDFLDRACSVNARDRKEPGFKKILYIRGILKNRLDGRYFDPDKALDLLESARASGVDLDELQRLTKRASSWNSWCGEIEDLIVHQRQGEPRPPPNTKDAATEAAPSERQELYTLLANELARVGTEELPRIIGYVKGTALSNETFADQTEGNPPPERSIELDGILEAFGFGDALGLQRTKNRSALLLSLGPIDTRLTFALETDEIEGIRPSYFLKADK